MITLVRVIIALVLSRLELAAREILSKASVEIVTVIHERITVLITPAVSARRAPQKGRARHKRRRKLVPLRIAVAKLEREHIQLALAENGHSVIRAARALRMPVTTLKYKLKKHKIP